MLKHSTVVVDGISISYLEREPAAGTQQTPLLLLHGLIATADTFAALIAQLPVDRRIVALNLPGTSLTGRESDRDLSFAGFANLVRGAAAELGLHRPIVLGHSHGGAIALQMAATDPDFAAALILLSPAHPYLYRERPLVAFYCSPPGRAFAYLLPWLPQRLQIFGFRRMLGPAARKGSVDFTPYRQRLRAPHAVEQVLLQLRTWTSDMDRLDNDLQKQALEMPVLFLWGDHDPVVPLTTGPALQRHMTQWQEFTLPGVGHLANEEAPEKCGSLIRTWLIWRQL
jgi:magnesium chelatase accessory protein